MTRFGARQAGHDLGLVAMKEEFELSSQHPKGHEHDEQTKRPARSGSSGPDTTLERQAGSYGRDAEQNPADAPDSTAESRDPKERPGT